MDAHELEDINLELGDGLDGILYEQTSEFLSCGGHMAVTDQMIDAVFVDIDKDDADPQKKYDNEITEDELCAKLASINSYFGTSGDKGGAEELLDWLDWAINTHKIEITSGKGSDGTRTFTPYSFRKLIRLGTNHT